MLIFSLLCIVVCDELDDDDEQEVCDRVSSDGKSSVETEGVACIRVVEVDCSVIFPPVMMNFFPAVEDEC